jgi:hypothetical protein
MKTLSDVIRATEMRNAKAIVETARGSPNLTDCLMVMAIPDSDAKIRLTGILVGPDNTVDDPSFDLYLADLDDPKTWLSPGIEPESANDDFYDHYEDYPGGLPDDMSLDTLTCSTGNCLLPPATTAYEEDSEFDSDLVEGLIGIIPQCLYEAGITERDFMKAWPYLVGDEVAPAQNELDLLFAPAMILLGKGWQSKLRDISGYSQGHLQQVYRGKRAVTAKLKTALLKAYREEISRCEERASRGMAGVVKILEAR